MIRIRSVWKSRIFPDYGSKSATLNQIKILYISFCCRHATITNRPFNLMGRASRLVRPRPSNPTHPPARAVSLGWRVGPRTNRAFTQNMTIAPKDVQVQELTYSSYNDNISSCVDLMGESSDNYGEDSSYDDYAANYQVKHFI